MIFLFFKELHLSFADLSIFAGRSVNVDELILGISSKFFILDGDSFLTGNSIRVKQIFNIFIPVVLYIRNSDSEIVRVFLYHIFYVNLKISGKGLFLMHKCTILNLGIKIFYTVVDCCCDHKVSIII